MLNVAVVTLLRLAAFKWCFRTAVLKTLRKASLILHGELQAPLIPLQSVQLVILMKARFHMTLN